MWIFDGATLASLMRYTAAAREATPVPKIQTSREPGSRDIVPVNGRDMNRETLREGEWGILFVKRLDLIRLGA
jgi:hypothetical protein